jgi:PhnB protein
MMQMYVKGSVEAVLLYVKAFDAKLGCKYRNDDGSYMHSELNAFGQILAVSEAADDIVSGSNMQFCFHFEKEETEKVRKAYEILKDGAKIVWPLGPCSYSPYMFALIDKFGISWCLFA